jgi:hypothetical protein
MEELTPRQKATKKYYITHKKEIREKDKIRRNSESYKKIKKDWSIKYKLSGRLSKVRSLWRNKNAEKLNLYKRKWRKTKIGKTSTTNSFKKQISKNPDKFLARQSVMVAIRSGKLIKKPCKKCANPKSEAHHKDYTKPLDVIWLCRKCHIQIHL